MSNNIMDIDTNDVHYTDKRCAPTIKFDNGSCIGLSMLVEMAKAYNKDAGNSEIVLRDDLNTLNPNKYKKYLLSEFNKRLGDKCTTQKCWTEQKFINKMQQFHKDELKKYTFRPKGPEGRFEWLNTLHINDIMGQYEKKYQDFKYLGTVPIDFDDFDEFGIKNLNYLDLVKSGKTKLGVVYNLDKHNQSGSHWVSTYADLKKGELYFFDSYAVRPPPEVRKYMRRLTNFVIDDMGIEDPIVNYNHKRHQYENSECGVYSINFILRLLRGDTFEQICGSRKHDRKINKCRNVYFGNVDVKKKK